MRAVMLGNTGGPEALRVVDIPTPVAREAEVLIDITCAGVAYAQVMMRHGTYPYAPPFPFVPGAEVVGTVRAVGANVADWDVGDRVTAFSSVGGYAESVVLPASALVHVPPLLDDAQVAALPMNYVTAYQLLHRMAKVQRGETLVVHGAAGGVGTALVQLARDAGVRVIGTAKARDLPLIESLGAIGVDYTAGDVAEQVHARVGRVDVVLDPIGGDHLLVSRRMLESSGRLIAYGFSGPGAATREAVATLRERLAAWSSAEHGLRAELYSLGEINRRSPSLIRDDLSVLVELLAQHRIAPIIAGRLPLEQVQEAHRRLEAGGVSGKLVLLMPAALST
jgi:NADPH:quinone reductase-like Zn-dependent oxidoreductase